MAAAIAAAVLIGAMAPPIRAQAFEDRTRALVDYSKADFEPHKTCEAMSRFKSKEITLFGA